jgi:hypothetical protein
VSCGMFRAGCLTRSPRWRCAGEIRKAVIRAVHVNLQQLLDKIVEGAQSLGTCRSNNQQSSRWSSSFTRPPTTPASAIAAPSLKR